MTPAEPERTAITPAVGLALVGVALLVLVADRMLGLTAFAVDPGEGLPVPQVGSAPLLADLIAALVVGPTLVVIELIDRPRRAGRRRLVVIVAALVGLQLGASAAEAVTGVPVAVDLYLGRALLVTGALLAARMVLRSLVEHRAAMRALRAETANAEALGASGRTALLRLREDASTRVRDVLRDALDALAVGGGALAGPVGPEAMAARLRGLAEDVLRPLSHRLASAPSVELEAPPAVAAPRWRDTLAVVARRPVVPVRLLATIAALLAFLRTLVTDQATVGALQTDAVGATPIGVTATVDVGVLVGSLAEIALVLLATWWGASRVAAFLGRRRAVLTPTGAWGVTQGALLLVAALTLVAPVLVGAVAGLEVPEVGVLTLVASYVPLLVVTLGVSIIGAVADERTALRAALMEQGRATARVAARTQAILAHEQQRLARTLHADVQAAVNAASLLLDRGARDDAVTPELIDDVAERIGDAVERFLRGSASDAALEARLDEVRALWAGVCAVTVDVAPDVATRIAGDTVTRELLVDLVAEACANAVVHGGAGRVTVTIGLAGEGAELQLSVVDDGRPTSRGVSSAVPGGAERSGLGSEVLRASCTRWELRHGEAGSVLTANVPLA